MLFTTTQSYESLDELFGGTEEGQDQVATPAAVEIVRLMLGEGEIEWHLPDVFSVRYGSNYVATARVNGNELRFLQPEGEFKDGDDA